MSLRSSVLGACTLFVLGGCASSSSAPPEPGGYNDPATVQSALDTSDGNLSMSSEQPSFGDPQVEGLDSFDANGADPTDMTTGPAAQPGAKRYHLALLWGHMPAPADATAADTEPQLATWTGSVSIDDGAIGVKKTLQFDAKDSVSPRTDAKTVSFVSHTLPFVDGLFLHVVVPANASPVLHFKTETLTTDLDLSQLAAKEGGVDRVPNTSNGLAWIGYEDVAGCSRGLLFGRWVKLRAALGGFRGQVIDGDGERVGHVRGIWGHAPRKDANVFFGKYIGVNGEARGLLAGKYGDGGFAGIWGTRDPKSVGALEGVYSDGFDKNDGRGVFVSRWSEKCE